METCCEAYDDGSHLVSSEHPIAQVLTKGGVAGKQHSVLQEYVAISAYRRMSGGVADS